MAAIRAHPAGCPKHGSKVSMKGFGGKRPRTLRIPSFLPSFLPSEPCFALGVGNSRPMALVGFLLYVSDFQADTYSCKQSVEPSCKGSAHTGL
eukprot:2465923-Amphidinium_carterae.1